MASVAPRHAAYDDLLSLPRNVVGEIVDGELHTHPRPGGPHAAVASLLGMVLGNPFHRGSGGPGGWIILDEPELHLGADVLVPTRVTNCRAGTPRPMNDRRAGRLLAACLPSPAQCPRTRASRRLIRRSRRWHGRATSDGAFP